MRPAHFVAIGFVLAAGLAGCGKSPSHTADAPIMQMFGDGPPLSGSDFMLAYPDITVQPGEENTQCVWMKLSNTTPIKVHQVHNILSNNTHHLIVYKDNADTTEQTT